MANHQPGLEPERSRFKKPQLFQRYTAQRALHQIIGCDKTRSTLQESMVKNTAAQTHENLMTAALETRMSFTKNPVDICP